VERQHVNVYGFHDGVELNRRLFQAAEACRREIGIQKNNDLEQQLRGTEYQCALCGVENQFHLWPPRHPP